MHATCILMPSQPPLPLLRLLSIHRRGKSNSATQTRHKFDSQIYLQRAAIPFLPLRQRVSDSFLFSGDFEFVFGFVFDWIEFSATFDSSVLNVAVPVDGFLFFRRLQSCWLECEYTGAYASSNDPRFMQPHGCCKQLRVYACVCALSAA